MLKMIKYNLKNRSLLIIISTIISLVIAFASFDYRSFLEYHWIYQIEDTVIGPSDSPMGFITTMACIFATIIPLLEFSFKMKKINIDQMYSLPIKREKLYLAKFISGFIEILIPTCVIFIYCLLKVISTDHMYEMIYFLPYFGCLVFFTFILYSTITFFFTRANTVIDGIINVLSIILLFEVVVWCVDEVFDYSISINNGSYFLYSPISILTAFFNDKLSIKALTEIYAKYNVEYNQVLFNSKDYIPIILFIIVGIASFVLFIFLNKTDKAEDSMQVSNSWFSYRTIIPLYFALFSLIMIKGEAMLISFIFLFVGAYIAYIVYRRTLKIKKWDILVIAIVFVASIIFVSIFDALTPKKVYEYAEILNSFKNLL